MSCWPNDLDPSSPTRRHLRTTSSIVSPITPQHWGRISPITPCTRNRSCISPVTPDDMPPEFNPVSPITPECRHTQPLNTLHGILPTRLIDEFNTTSSALSSDIVNASTYRTVHSKEKKWFFSGPPNVSDAEMWILLFGRSFTSWKERKSQFMDIFGNPTSFEAKALQLKNQEAIFSKFMKKYKRSDLRLCKVCLFISCFILFFLFYYFSANVKLELLQVISEENINACPKQPAGPGKVAGWTSVSYSEGVKKVIYSTQAHTQLLVPVLIEGQRGKNEREKREKEKRESMR
jgi:hypothetical protein